MKPKNLFIIGIIILINFGIQSFNFLRLDFCDFYTFHPDCSAYADVMVNKLIRLFLNMMLIQIILDLKKPQLKTYLKQGVFFVSTLLLLDWMVFFMLPNSGFIVVHKVLNPLLYSPLIAIALLAFKLIQKDQVSSNN